LALALAALFWSGNFVAGRALRGQVDPVTLNFLRWLIAFALLAPLVWRGTAASIKAVRREWRLILALGATGIASFHTLVYIALQSTTATSALLILSLAPILTLLGSAAMAMERPTNRQIGGALISILGAGILITRGNPSGILSQGLNVGDLWMLLAVVIWAAYSLLLRRRLADLPSPVAMPIFGAGLAFSVLGEVPTPAQAAGAALVLSGIALVESFARAHRSVTAKE
jgi:drug/metabolite transporter (DMT)-like permease